MVFEWFSMIRVEEESWSVFYYACSIECSIAVVHSKIFDQSRLRHVRELIAKCASMTGTKLLFIILDR